MSKSIEEYYKGQSVFITGGTGSLGKVLLEKLLYSCPGIDKIYVLIREKRNVSAEQRIEKLLELPLFSRLKEEAPQALQKLEPIVGDVSKDHLGIDPRDAQLLLDKVSIVFHLAATVKFNEPLKDAMNLNVEGTRRLLNLSKNMKNLKAFVHVSTTYSNADKKVIKEIIYPAPATPDEVYSLLDSGINEKQTKQLLNGKANTYIFTKALAESLVAENNDNLPIVIVRPSIVSASKAEPIPAWIDSWYGASPLMSSIMKGLNRVLYARPNTRLDLIPADYVSNLIIVAASECKRSKQVPVYNCSTSAENPITLKEISDMIIEDSCKHKFYDIPWPMVFYSEWKWVVLMITLFFEKIPAYMADLVLLLTCQKTRFRRYHSKLEYVRDTSGYIIANDWVIPATRTRALSASLSLADRVQFPFDPSDIDWKTYIPIYCLGIRRYLCKT